MENYGNGPSTGLDQTALGKMSTGFVPADLTIIPADREVLRRLAERVAALAASPPTAEKRRLWHQLNTLQQTRPVIFCDPENGWNEIITETQMECRGKLARRWEMDLRKEIFWGEEMGDDRPVEPHFDVPYTVSPDDWGLETVFHEPGLTDGARRWDAPIQDYDRDLRHLHDPEFEIDWTTTHGCLELARETLGDLLQVRLKGIWWWSLGLTLPAVMLRGLGNMMLDFADHPDELKELLARLSQGYLAKLDYLEANDLLSLNNDGTYVGSGGFGFTDELPQPNFSGSVRCRDLWGFAESQETVEVSPDMYAEFVFPAEQPLLARFGLNCYGCCEPVHARWEAIARHPNLRRVSCSPWADYEQMADHLQYRYIFSMKPNPTPLSFPKIDREGIRTDLRHDLEVTRGCAVEVIMKDNHTIGGRPENVTDWCRIAREEAEGISG